METIGFIGTGQMARALATGFLAAKLAQAGDIVGSDPSRDAGREFEAAGGRLVRNNRAVLEAANIVFLAVKPQMMDSVLEELHPHVDARHLLVSIAAGVSLARLAAGLGEDRRIIRVMPNTPCLARASASAYSLGAAATPDDGRRLEQLLAAVGIACQVPEHWLDAVTGLSGSGPAYVFLMIEALSDGGVRAGLPRDLATRLAAQTVLGSAKMVLDFNRHPAALKDMVTSPGGTTIAGLAVLESRAVRGAFIDAVEAATRRSRELGAS